MSKKETISYEKTKKIPKFKTEEEENMFWQQNDSSDYLDWSKSKEISFNKLKPSSTSISIRLPNELLNDIRNIANKNDVPYQSLIKVWLSEMVGKVIQQRHL